MTDQRLLAVSPNLPCAMDRQEWSLEDYHICKTLYNGYAAQVYTATCRYSGMEVVLKVYHDVNKAPDVAQHEMYREVAIQGGVQHPNVVHLFGAFEEGDTLVLVQEYVPNGDLLALMQSHGGRVDEATVVKSVLRPLLTALMYLHRWGIVHRDVKPENVLFAADGSIKLADFGLAINMVEERPISRVGTLDYMAPEVLRCPIKQSMAMSPAPGAPARYGFATDVWAVGIVTYELLTGLPPYASECRYQAESRICSSLPPIFPHCTSPMARDFILRALAPIPGDRPTIRQLLEHPWILNPEGYMATSRQRAHPYSYPLTQPPSQLQPTTTPRCGLAMSQPNAANHSSTTEALPLHTGGGGGGGGGYNKDLLHTDTAAATAAAAAATPRSVAAATPRHLAVAWTNTAAASPAPSPTRQDPSSRLNTAIAAAASTQGCQIHHPYHQNQNHVMQHLQHDYLKSQAPAPSDSDAALSLDQQLRALQQQQLVDLSKLPLEQIQGMIQKLQEAMQLAVIQQQQQVRQPADSGASAAEVVDSAVGPDVPALVAQSRCSGGGGGGSAPAFSSNALRLRTVVEDVHMTDIARSIAADATALASGTYTTAGVAADGGPRSAAAAAAPSTARSCTNSPQQQQPRTTPRSAAAAAAVAATCVAPVAVADSSSYATTAAEYAAGHCSSRGTTVDVTARAAFAAVPADSTSHADFVRHLASKPRAGGACTAAGAAAAAQRTLTRNAEGDGTVQVTVVATMPCATTTPRPTCGGSGDGSSGGAVGNGRCSHSGALHEGDGLVFVSIGSSRKAAGLAQCEGGCPGANVGLRSPGSEAVAPTWGQQLASP